MKRVVKIVAMNLMVLCTLVVSMEAACQIVYFIRHGKSLFAATTARSPVFEVHPYLVGRPDSCVSVEQNGMIISTTQNHTRWTGASPGDHDLVRVAVLGGSTTFGTNVTDQDSWPALLQTILGEKYAVINYGVPGYSTAENIIQMALVVPEKRPHFVVFYEGWNDIRNYHEKDLGADYYGHGMRQYEGLGINGFGQQGKYQILKDTYATVWLMSAIKNRIAPPPAIDCQLFDGPDSFVDKIYNRNLGTLKLLAKNIQAVAIFVPQILNYSDYKGKADSYQWTRCIRNSSMPKLMSRFNAYMDDVCQPGEQDCVVLREVLGEKWEPEDFVDNGHFTRSGGAKFAEIIARFIIREHDNGKGNVEP